MKIKKLVFQEEICPKTNTPHLQGVVQFNNQVSFSTIKEHNNRCHWEATKDLKGSMKYCSKPESRKPDGRIVTIGDVKLWVEHVELTDEEINGHLLKEHLKAALIDKDWLKGWNIDLEN